MKLMQILREVLMRLVSQINLISFLFKRNVNLVIGESHVRYLLADNVSSNHAFFNKIRKSSSVNNVYFVWTNMLAYKIVMGKLEFDLDRTLCIGAKKTLFISAGEIDIRYHCANEDKMSGRELGERVAAWLLDVGNMSCVNKVYYIMPLPPNRMLINSNKCSGSYEERIEQYFQFVGSLQVYGVNIISIPFVRNDGGFPAKYLSEDFIHLNEEGLSLVREELKKYIS